MADGPGFCAEGPSFCADGPSFCADGNAANVATSRQEVSA